VLHLVVAGTTRWDGADGRKPFNRCHVFDHAGEEIFRQDKISRWNMDRGACARFGLLGVDGAAPDMLHEFIEPAEAVAIVERPHFGRIAVMICEDLHRSEPGGWIRDTMLIDWQFTPVLDASLTPDRWSALHGGRAALAGSCRVVVANSFPMTHRQNAVNARSSSGYPVVSDCGVGLCLDRHDDAVRATVLRLSLDGEGSDTHGVVDWQPDQWDMAPALELVGAL
jgi:predicted amidohydrolase